MSISEIPHLDPDLVYEFMAAVHKDMDKVRSMVENEPGLANAASDVGGGAYETALGGAAHMGRGDIAVYLLSNGARMDIFCAAMLGKNAIVEAFLNDDPSIAHLKGPHGIPLIKHAERGGQNEIVELLKSYDAKA